MIILRHKPEERQYSGRFTKLIRGVKKTTDAVGVAVNNAGLKAGNALNIRTVGAKVGMNKAPGVEGRGADFKFKRKTNRQINREAIETRNNLKQSAKEGVVNAINEVNNVAINGPGELARQGMEFAGKNPIGAASQVGGKVLMVTNPETALIPVGGIGAGAEMALKKKVPAYAKGTKKLGEFFDEDHLGGKVVKHGTNAVVQGVKNVAGVI